jgi:polyribonucleotide nucleotidyltransferase
MSNIINPNGKDIFSVTTELCGKPLTLEVNRVGFRASGSVLVKYGDTVVLGSVSVGTRPVVLDYFPLSIDYEEKFYAAGKISGSRFIKREGRPSDDAVLTSRLIDRPIRPLFPKGYRQEVQVISTVLSMDPSFRPDMVAMIAASAALMLTGTPFDGPVAGLRVGRVNGEFKAFLSPEEREQSDLDLVVAGIESGVTMVEAGAEEVPEDVIVDAIDWAFKALQPAIALQKELKEKVAPAEREYTLVLPDEDIQTVADEWVEGKFGAAIRRPYPERNEMINEIRLAYHIEMAEKNGGEEEYKPLRDEYDEAFTKAIHADVRKGIVEDNVRPDGRKLDEIRPLSSEVGFLPRAHGSSLFTRGVTQGMNIVTLAPLSYAQMADNGYVHQSQQRDGDVGNYRRYGNTQNSLIGHMTYSTSLNMYPLLFPSLSSRMSLPSGSTSRIRAQKFPAPSR